MDLVSIVIPVYNVEKYIHRCIDSILKQKYSNLEIILVDDGSTDSSSDICDVYSKKDRRIKVYHKKNGGVSSARNLGIKKSKGKYITFIDADDYVDEFYVLNLYNNICKGYSAVYSNAIDFNDNGYLPSKKSDSNYIFTKNEILKELLYEKKVSSIGCCRIYLTSIVKKIKFDEHMKIAEDLKFNIDYLDIINDDKKFFLQKERNYYYYLRKGSATHSEFNNNWYDEIEYCRSLISKYKNTPIYEYAIKRFIRINTTCLDQYKLNKIDFKIIKKNINQYKKQYLLSNITSLKHRVKFFVKYYILINLKKRI